MAATVITISPRVPVGSLVQQVYDRVERDGVASVVARQGERSQVRQLRRVAHRLAADPKLDVTYGDQTDGSIRVTVFPAGQRSAGVWGDGRIG